MSNRRQKTNTEPERKQREEKTEPIINLYNNKLFSDLILESADGIFFHVSSCVMAYHSKWFNDYLININDKKSTVKIDFHSKIINIWLREFHFMPTVKNIPITNKNYDDFELIVGDVLLLYVKYDMQQNLNKLIKYTCNKDILNEKYVTMITSVSIPSLIPLQNKLIFHSIVNDNPDNIVNKLSPKLIINITKKISRKNTKYLSALTQIKNFINSGSHFVSFGITQKIMSIVNATITPPN